MFGSRVGFLGPADRMALFRVISNPRWRLTAILENFEWPYLGKGSCYPLHVKVLCQGFRSQRNEWRYFRLHQTQVGGRPPSWIILNGCISAVAHPIHFVLGYRVCFSGSAYRMALFSVNLGLPTTCPFPKWGSRHDRT